MNGDVHAASAPASRRHCTLVAPVVVNDTATAGLFDSAAGCAVIETVGATVSITNACVVACDELPAPSATFTVIVCVPSASVAAVNGEVQLANAAASIWHWMLVGAPAVVNPAVGVLSLDRRLGSMVNATVGGAVSIVK